MYTSKLWEFYQEYFLGLLIIGSLCLSMISNEILGFACIILSVIASLANLESIQQIMVTNHYNSIDLKMTLSNLTSGLAWMIYGILISNMNIIFSNSISIIVSTILIIFHSYFRIFYKKYGYS